MIQKWWLTLERIVQDRATIHNTQFTVTETKSLVDLLEVNMSASHMLSHPDLCIPEQLGEVEQKTSKNTLFNSPGRERTRTDMKFGLVT